MATTTLRADSAPANDVRTVRETLANWNDYRGLTPFGGANSGHAVDRSGPALAEANAILGMLSAACSDAQTLMSAGKTSEFDARNMEMLAGALDGVSTLIDLASFMLED